MPASVSLEVRGLREAQKAQMDALAALSGPPMVQAMRDATLITTATARRLAKVDIRRYRASITPEVQVAGDVVKGIVGSNVEYSPYVVLDTRPHFPPLAALQVWARRHGVSAYLVARKIARRGTKGDQSLIRGVTDNAERIYQLLERACWRAIGE